MAVNLPKSANSQLFGKFTDFVIFTVFYCKLTFLICPIFVYQYILLIFTSKEQNFTAFLHQHLVNLRP
jgi:hypothetical protein